MVSRTGPIHHGGAIDWAAKRYGLPRSRWLDLSTGINPLAYPQPHIAPENWQRLPDQDLVAAALSAAKDYYGVPQDAQIIAAPGSQALIQWLPYLLPRSDVAILSPTYEEHQHCWARAGHRVSLVEHAAENADLVVLVNPDNPSGRKRSPSDILTLRRSERLLIVDEAFADVAPEISCISQTGDDGLLVLRSFGKFFGLAGARLGFAVGAPKMIDRLAQALGPWSVSGAVLQLAKAAFADADWIAASRTRLVKDRQRLDRLLIDTGFSPLGDVDLFACLSHKQAAALFDHLARQAILVRHFPDAPDLLRFGLPGPDQAWRRLEQALGQFKLG